MALYLTLNESVTLMKDGEVESKTEHAVCFVSEENLYTSLVLLKEALAEFNKRSCPDGKNGPLARLRMLSVSELNHGVTLEILESFGVEKIRPGMQIVYDLGDKR